MDSGLLVPDDVTIRMLLERLGRPDAARGAILDGFPRTAAQAAALDELLATRRSQVDAALLIDVPVEALVARLTGRRVCRANGHPYHLVDNPPAVAGVCDLDGSDLYQRDDDREDTIVARLESQLGALAEVVEHYRRTGVLRTVDGMRPIDEVTEELIAALATEPTAR
jgi:adenylate kinase